MGRRAFLHTSVAASALAGAVGAGPAARAQGSEILNQQPGMKYRPLGKTGISLSVISNGGLVSVESVIHYAIDKGVNLVHVAEDYLGGRSIATYGAVLKTKRDKVYIALKDDFSDIDTVLKTLNTDHADFLMFNRHSPNAVADPRLRETFEKYRKAGKVRWAGLTCHGAVKETTRAAVNAGWFALVMPSMNQSGFEAMQEELRLAAQKDVGIMPMKTMNGLVGIATVTAYLKKMLANPAITTVVHGLRSFEFVDAYLKAINEPLTVAEDRALYRHAQANRARNCMMCSTCQGACPEGIDVPAILRAKNYYHDQCGDFETASLTYAALERTGSAACRDCRKCEQACPNGIPIVDRLEAARQFFAV
jgi:hypothetical protein